MLATAASTLDRFLFSVLMVPIKADLGLTDTQLGLLAGFGFALLYCAVSIPFGRLADVAVRRTIIAAAIAFWSFATLAMTFADSYAELLVCRLLAGFGEAALVPAAISMIADLFNKARLGKATAVFGTGSTIGKAFAFIGGGTVLAHFAQLGGAELFGHSFRPWQATVLVIAPTGLLVAMLMFTVREPARRAAQAQGDWRELIRHMRLHAGAYGLFTASWCCVFVIIHTLATWSPSFYSRSFDLDITKAAAIGGFASLFAGPVGNAIGGAAIDLLERRASSGPSSRVLAAGMLVVLAAVGLVVLSPSLPISILSYVIVMAAALTGGPAGYTAIQKMTPAHHRGMATALIFSIASLCGLGVGPLLVGAFSDLIFEGRDALGHAMLSVLYLFAALGSCIAFFSRRLMDKAVASAELKSPV